MFSVVPKRVVKYWGEGEAKLKHYGSALNIRAAKKNLELLTGNYSSENDTWDCW